MKVLQTTILAWALSAITASLSAEHLKLNLRSVSKGTGEGKTKTELTKWRAEKPRSSFATCGTIIGASQRREE